MTRISASRPAHLVSSSLTTSALSLTIGAALLVPTALATAAASSTNCHDSLTYLSKLGLSCSQHAPLKCNGFSSAGFTSQEVDELINNCPVSCGNCNDKSAAGMRRKVMADLKGRDYIVDLRRREDPLPSSSVAAETVSSDSAKERPRMNNQQQQPQRRTSLGACKPGWVKECQDDPNYKSQLELPCWAHAVIDCTALEDIGYTEMEVMELVESCPCSCNVECGTFTLSPTLFPTESPTESKMPTLSPTFKPTPVPTTPPTPSPTRTPTRLPTLAPTASPTFKPSRTPTTSSPTAKPSFAPTPVPTKLPTSSPTNAPTTSSPTNKPTTSSPTSKPTLNPTFIPTSVPTNAPTPVATEDPTQGPTSNPTYMPTWPFGKPLFQPPAEDNNEAIATDTSNPVPGNPRSKASPSALNDGENPKQQSTSDPIPIFIIAGIAAGGVAFVVWSSILFFKIGKGPRTPSTSMPPRSRKGKKKASKLILAELQASYRVRDDSTDNSEYSDDWNENHSRCSKKSQSSRTSRMSRGSHHSAKPVQHQSAQQLRQMGTATRSRSSVSDDSKSVLSRAKQVLAEDISMRTRDIGNVEVELDNQVISRTYRSSRGSSRHPSPCQEPSHEWCDQEHGGQSGSSVSNDETYDHSAGVEGAMASSKTKSSALASPSNATAKAENSTPKRAAAHIAASKSSRSSTSTPQSSTSRSHGAASSRSTTSKPQVATSRSHGSASSRSSHISEGCSYTTNKEKLVYRGNSSVGSSPTFEVVRTRESEAVAAQKKGKKSMSKRKAFLQLFGKKKSSDPVTSKDDPSKPPNNVIAPDVSENVSRFTFDGPTFDETARTPSGILKGVGQESAEGTSVNAGVSFDPSTRFDSAASLGDVTLKAANGNGRSDSDESTGGGFGATAAHLGGLLKVFGLWNNVDDNGEKEPNAMSTHRGPMDAPQTLSAIPTDCPTNEVSTIEGEAIERPLTASGSVSRSQGSAPKGRFRWAPKGSAVEVSTIEGEAIERPLTASGSGSRSQGSAPKGGFRWAPKGSAASQASAKENSSGDLTLTEDTTKNWSEPKVKTSKEDEERRGVVLMTDENADDESARKTAVKQMPSKASTKSSERSSVRSPNRPPPQSSKKLAVKKVAAKKNADKPTSVVRSKKTGIRSTHKEPPPKSTKDPSVVSVDQMSSKGSIRSSKKSPEQADSTSQNAGIANTPSATAIQMKKGARIRSSSGAKSMFPGNSTSFEDIDEKSFNFAVDNAPMVATIASKDRSGKDSQDAKATTDNAIPMQETVHAKKSVAAPPSEERSVSTRSKKSVPSARPPPSVDRSVSTRSLSTRDKGNVIEEASFGSESIPAPFSSIAAPDGLERIVSSLTTPTVLKPDESVNEPIDQNPSNPQSDERTSSKCGTHHLRQHHRSDEHDRRHHEDVRHSSGRRRHREHSRERHHEDVDRSSSRHRDREHDDHQHRPQSSSRHRHRREHNDRPPRAHGGDRHRHRHREHSSARHLYDEHRHRGHRRHHHPHDDRHDHHHHHHDDHDRRRARSSTRRQEHSRERKTRNDEQKNESHIYLFRPKLPFMDSESTPESESHSGNS